MSGVTRILAAVAIVGSGVVGVVAGQARPAAPATMDDLLAEVRALRGEIREAAGSSMRAQLVGMRLQLQEQRITTLSRQLSDTQEKLRDQEADVIRVTSALKMFARDDDTKPEEMNMVTGPLRAQLAQLEKAVQQLKQDEIDASQLLAEEQSRWTRFNALVEELERAAAPPRGR
jgi:hypothetical protein